MSHFDVAIIGLSCRFPGARNVEEYWRLLMAGTDAVTAVPDDRWDKSNFFHPQKGMRGKAYSFSAGVLDDIAGFDAEFFGISPREAEQMDPQQRLLLEVTWEAFEDAGQVQSNLAGSNCAVMIGISGTDYGSARQVDTASGNAYSMLGSTLSIAANRISYQFNLKGPSMAIDTACSSSLVAFNEALNMLWSGRSELAVAGGVNLLASPYPFVGFSAASMLSEDGRCKAFSDKGDGYVRGEGCGVFILKPLAAALRDNDTIQAVISGAGVNSDGKTNGIAMPSIAGQQQLLESVMAKFDISPKDIAYFEAHGTGTAVGDPIETAALGAAIGQKRDPGAGPLILGSAKSNIGHLEPASGMAGLVKAVQIVKNRQVPKTLHCQDLNPNIDFEGLNILPAQQTVDLADDGRPVQVGVNSFGFGGTNATVFLKSPPPQERRSETVIDRQAPPLIISANSEQALVSRAGQIAQELSDPSKSELYDIAFAAAFKRDCHAYRALIWGKNRAETSQKLEDFALGGDTDVASSKVVGPHPKIGFVFSGNGSQWPGMGREMYQTNAVFRDSMDRLDDIFQRLAGWSVVDLILSETHDEQLNLTEYAQPALFSVQVALCDSLADLGIVPDGVVGHSVGEVAAAHMAGALELKEAVKLILWRSEAQGRTRGKGKMAAVSISPEAAQDLIARQSGLIELAAINSGSAVTLTGDGDALRKLEDEFQNSSTMAKVLDLDYAFHSRFLDPEQSAFLDKAANLAVNETILPFYSTVAGKPLDGRSLAADYWWQNARQPVDFRAAIGAMAVDGYQLFIEIGPHPVLQSYIRGQLRESSQAGQVIPTMARGNPGQEAISQAADTVFVCGGARDFSGWFREEGQRVSLPPYPWQRENHWTEPSSEAVGLFFSQQDGLLLGTKHQSSVPIWENQIDTGRFPFLADHCVGGNVVFPATGFIEIALEASMALFGGSRHEIAEFEIRRPLVLSEKESKILRFSYFADDKIFHLETRQYAGDQTWTLNAVGRLAPAVFDGPENPSLSKTLPFSGPFSADGFYSKAKTLGLDYGPAFQRLKDWTRTDEEGLINLAMADAGDHSAEFALDPLSFDSCLQGLLAMILRETDEDGTAFLPQQLKRLKLYQTSATIRHCRVHLDRQGKRSNVASFRLYDEKMALVAEAIGFRFLRADFLKRKYDSARAYCLKSVPTMTIGESDRIMSPKKLMGHASLEDYKGVDLNRLADLTLLKEKVSLPAEVTGNLEGWRRHLYFRVKAKGKRTKRKAEENVCKQAIKLHPDALPEILHIGTTAASLTDILAQSQSAPSLSTSLKQQLLQSSPYFAPARTAILTLLQKVIQKWPANRRLRILDMSPSSALPSGLDLEADWLRIDYSIVNMAEEAVPAPSLGPQVKKAAHVLEQDLSSPLRTTEIGEIGVFDIVVGAQMTLDIGLNRTLISNLSKLLAPNGLLVASDVKHQPWLDLAFGCREEWWDSSGRPALGESLRLPDLLSVEGFQKQVQVETDEHILLTAQAPAARPGRPSLTEAPSDNAVWLIATSSLPASHMISETVSQAVQLSGHRCVTITSPDAEEADGNLGSWSDVLSAFTDTDTVLAGIILVTEGSDGWPLLQAAKALVQAEINPLPALKLLTLDRSDQASNRVETKIYGRTALGAGRVLKNEFPALNFSYCEVKLAADAQPPRHIEKAIDTLLNGEENEIFLSDQGVFVPRLMERPLTEKSIRRKAGQKLDFLPGKLDALKWKPAALPKPGADQIVIETRLAGLNFRDVMFVSGMLPEEALENGFSGPTIGLEASGVVTSIGRNVTDLAVGDEVICYAADCFSTHILVDAIAAIKKPLNYSLEEAATMTTVFLTAYYALKNLADIQADDRILIHGAAGGVGLAAVQYAQHVGAEVFVSVGSEEKRSVMRLLDIPEDHIFDSRSLRFADDILLQTEGEGVDIVLNSLAGEAVYRSLDLLRPLGRFLELGKRDFYENNRIGLKFFRNNLSYFGIDLDQLMAERPAFCRRLHMDVVELFNRDVFSPLPFRVFDSSQVVEAFRTLQQSQHIGKILIRPPKIETKRQQRGSRKAMVTAAGAYLVSGGTSGFGLETARWLAQKGAGALILIGRNGTLRETDQPILTEIEDSGCRLYVRRCDVTDYEALEKIFAEVAADGFPLKGIVHAASVFEDGLIEKLDQAAYENVMRPKADGAWTLHEVSKERELDFFVLYSSVTTLFGNPGQANYVAANSELEYLAHFRNEKGLPALAIGWGPIADSGYVARDADLKASLEDKLGGKSLTTKEAMTYLDAVLGVEQGVVHIAAVNWPRLKPALPMLREPLFKHVIGAGGGQSDETAEDIQAKICGLDRPAALDLITGLFLQEIANVTGQSPERIDPGKSLPDLGMDSLMGLELSHAVEARLGIELPALSFAESSSISDLSVKIYERVSGDSSADEVMATHLEALVDKHRNKPVPSDPAEPADMPVEASGSNG